MRRSMHIFGIGRVSLSVVVQKAKKELKSSSSNKYNSLHQFEDAAIDVMCPLLPPSERKLLVVKHLCEENLFGCKTNALAQNNWRMMQSQTEERISSKGVEIEEDESYTPRNREESAVKFLTEKKGAESKNYRPKSGRGHGTICSSRDLYLLGPPPRPGGEKEIGHGKGSEDDGASDRSTNTAGNGKEKKDEEEDDDPWFDIF